MPQSRVGDPITHVTLNTINGVMMRGVHQTCSTTWAMSWRILIKEIHTFQRSLG